MWRAVLRSMYSSGLKPLTSAAILVSKLVVSKGVMRPTPETRSIMFDQTVSMSLPMGVTKPIPVTSTRRPLWLEVIRPAYGREVESAPAPSGKTGVILRTQRPKSISEELAEIERELQPEPGGGHVQVAAEQLLQLLQPVEDGVAVQPEGRGRLLDRAFRQVRLQRLQQLLSVADLWVHEPAQAVGHEPLREQGILREHQLRDHLVVAVDHRVRPELAACLEGLLRLQVGARDPVQPWVVAAQPGAHMGAKLARALLDLDLELGHEVADRVDVGERFGRPEHRERAGVGREEQGATAGLQRFRHLRQRLAPTLTVAVAQDELADDRDITALAEGRVDGEGLALELQLGVEVVADQGVEQASVRAGASLQVLLARVQVRLGHLGGDLVERGE